VKPGENTEAVRVLAQPPLVYLSFLAAGLALHYLWVNLHFFPAGWIGHAAGWPTFFLGLLLLLWSARTFSGSGENIRIEKPTNSLVTSGPFRFSRNPIYIGLTLAYIGLSLVFNSYWPLPFLPPVLIIIYYGVIKLEETYLEELFGQDYRDYRSQVRRWL
jgi:protein-S-isoprenylcysteine O-methyltransferase Ste14